ncbi:UNVERIFIED_CONTAM: hypothetical protein FKN15_004686 [Acipenser sinensis]
MHCKPRVSWFWFNKSPARNHPYPGSPRPAVPVERGSTLLYQKQCEIGYPTRMTQGPDPGHPRFFNQLFAGLDHHSLAGRFLTEALNSSQYTYEVAPVFVLMEEAVLSTLRSLIGWDSGDGIFCPGGSISNLYAMNLARYRAFPEVKQRGLWAVPRLAVFTSKECHYSVGKSASVLGVGLQNVHPVKVDERGVMIPEDLDEQIEKAKSQGSVPFLVSATSGTTILGAFDPLDKIADVCEKHKLWFHVDAAWGGSALLSKKHKHLLKGIDR